MSLSGETRERLPSLIIWNLSPTCIPRHRTRLNVDLCAESSDLAQLAFLNPFPSLAVTQLPGKLLCDDPTLSLWSILLLVQFDQSFSCHTIGVSDRKGGKATSNSPSSREGATGFSEMTFFPAFRAFSISAGCVAIGSEKITVGISVLASKSSKDSVEGSSE